MERTQRTITRLFAITALVAVFATSFGQGGFGGPPQGGPGQGQGGRGQGGPGGPGGPGQQMRMPRGPQLLRHPDVQKELKLSDAQMKEIDRAFPQMGGGPGGPGGPGGQGGFGGGQGGRGGGQAGPGGQRGGGQGGPGEQGGPNPQVDAKIKEILSPQQYSRFKQIEIQVAGPQAFGMPEVVERLKITEEQHQAIREVMQSMRPGPGQQGGQSDQRPDPAKRMKEVMAKVLAVLSDRQRSEFRAMTGKEFTLTMRPPMGGPGGPGGQGGPGGRRGGGGGTPPPDGGN